MTENVNIITESTTTTYDSLTSSATVTILLRRKSETEWLNSSYIPKAGEPCAELSDDRYIRFKIGDGIHRWTELPYAICGVDDGELI
jgi:hypothetical protein